MPPYGMTIKMEGSFEEVKTRVVEALKTQGFGILTEIDVQQTLKNKIGVDFKPYQILGACNPRLSHRALTADDWIGLLLPCNVVLKQENGYIEVGIQDPEVMFSVVDEDLKKSMSGFPQEVKKSLSLVLEVLQKDN